MYRANGSAGRTSLALRRYYTVDNLNPPDAFELRTSKNDMAETWILENLATNLLFERRSSAASEDNATNGVRREIEAKPAGTDLLPLP